MGIANCKMQIGPVPGEEGVRERGVTLRSIGFGLCLTTQVGTGRRGLPGFMKGRAFWTGFALISFIFWWNMIAWFYPTFPKFPTAGGVWIKLPRAYPPLWVFVSTVVICFSYFASLEVLFSLWLSDVLFILEGGALNRIGIPVSTPYC